MDRIGFWFGLVYGFFLLLLLLRAEMETEADGEEGISAAVHTQMQAKWKELSKKRYACVHGCGCLLVRLIAFECGGRVRAACVRTKLARFRLFFFFSFFCG